MILQRSISAFEKHGGYYPLEDAALTIHQYVAGETLSGLANRYYGDWRLWRGIADRNKIFDPRQIAPGTPLLIPELQIETGIVERN